MATTFYLFLSLLTLLLCFTASQGKGYTFSNCITDSDCVGNRSCLEATSGLSGTCLNDGKYCICAPADIASLTCSNISECDQGENCTNLLSTFLNVTNVIDGLCVDNSQLPYFENLQPCQNNLDCPSDAACMNIPTFSYCGATITERSEEPYKESSTEGGDACISSQALSNLPKTSLRYAKHKKAAVLCDKNGSCATPGHLVMYHGKTMMMRSYCRIVKCRNDVMDVNSPRYERALRIKSNTSNLEFLSFAARYGSRAEEGMFKVAVSLGL